MAPNKPEITDAPESSSAAPTSFTDYKEEATFPTERPSGKMLKKINNPKAPWNESFVMVERPRSPTPPVLIDTEGNEVEEETSPASTKKKEKKQTAGEKTVRFASTNSVRQLHDGPAGDAKDEKSKDDGKSKDGGGSTGQGRVLVCKNGAVYMPAGWKPKPAPQQRDGEAAETSNPLMNWGGEWEQSSGD